MGSEKSSVGPTCDDGKIQALDPHCHLPLQVNPPIST
jgi:hypothetical protein